MINTRSGMVSVFDESVIEERPWYVSYNEGDPIPTDPTVKHESLAVELIEEVVATEEVASEEPSEKPKRKNWKDAMAAKAQELEGDASGNQVDTESNQEAGSIAQATGDTPEQTNPVEGS